MITNVQIEPTNAADPDYVLSLLKENGLPRDGFVDHLATTLVARQSWRIVGSAALEAYSGGALLRSVAVASDLQGRGLALFPQAWIRADHSGGRA